MNKYNLYIKYKNILNKLNLPYGIKWGNGLAIDLWSLQTLKYKDILKQAIKTLLIDNEIIINKDSNDIDYLLVYSTQNRQDHKTSFEKVCECINNKCILEIDYKKKIKIKKLRIIKKIFDNYLSLNVIDNNLYRIFLSFKISDYEYIIDKVLNSLSDIKYNKLITYFDGCQIENIITQLNKDIMTLTLQHGQYIVQNKGEKNINVLPYENFISDYMIVWGESTVDELAKYNIEKKKLIVTGCPKFINNEENIIEEKINNNVFGILLNNEQQNQSNFRMIELANEICKKTGKKYILKMHPSNKLEDYINIIDKSCLLEVLDKNKTIFEYAKMVEFSIVHTSSVYVELNCMNSPVFRYKDENYLSMYESDKDEFSSIDEFLEKYNIMVNDYNSWKLYMAEISKYFVNTVKGTTQRYKEIMSKIN